MGCAVVLVGVPKTVPSMEELDLETGREPDREPSVLAGSWMSSHCFVVRQASPVAAFL